MKRIGIAGLQSFDAGRATPQVVDVRLPYMSDGWKTVFRGTAAYADAQQLELGIAASPGWSETGGPWVTGADAMKKVSWTATHVTGGRPFAGALAKPSSVTGIFGTSTAGWTLGGRAPGQHPPELYVDQKVLAIRVPADAVLPKPIVTSSGGTLDAEALGDGDIEKVAATLPAGKETGATSWIQFDYGRPVTIRGLTLATDYSSRYYHGLEDAAAAAEGEPLRAADADAARYRHDPLRRGARGALRDDGRRHGDEGVGRCPDGGDVAGRAARRDRAGLFQRHPGVGFGPATGLAGPVSYRVVAGRTEVTIPLDRLGTTFVVFRAAGAAPAPSRTLAAPQWRTAATLAGPWQVSFQPDRGAPPTATFAALQDFRENSDAGIRYFSGIATYPKTIDVAAGDLAGGRKVWLDLGEVNNLAEIWVNGALAGTAWKPPFRVDLTRFVKPGRNQVEIRVVNLWVNRLIGDVQPGVTKKITFTAADGKISPDTPPEQAAAERRMPYDANAPLIPSGLIGPLR